MYIDGRTKKKQSTLAREIRTNILCILSGEAEKIIRSMLRNFPVYFTIRHIY